MSNLKIASEKIRIAQDLHDGIAQDLVALGYQFDLMLAEPEIPANMRSELRTARFRIDELITKVRREIFALRQLNENSLAVRIGKSAAEICGNLMGRTDLDEVTGTLDQEEEIYMIACELLRNSAKHSGASVIEISLRQNENLLYLEVLDNGNGGAEVNQSGFGLKGIGEKVRNASGVLKIISNKEGTRTQITL
ncbi:unannotated protein [freshwater metagenome]|uniref:Unannotated protein n=1 Tax=freshwater metagenome TaxID=449393 RepID=A0A6J7DDX7_9ZZZZ|nr:hypothetical protein [Actinomycetota bacterium]